MKLVTGCSQFTPTVREDLLQTATAARYAPGLESAAVCEPFSRRAIQKNSVPDWLAERNLESWREIVNYYEDLERVSDASDTHLSPLLQLVRQFSIRDSARMFRAGQSLWHLIISTSEKYGLRDDEPSVLVTLVEKGRTFQLEYHRKPGGRPLEKLRCSETDVIQQLDRLLARLWDDTRGHPPESPLPGTSNTTE